MLAESVWWNVKSVLFEEFLFRGALLFLLIRGLGSHTACLISAIFFGVYHWFSMGAFWNPAQMLILFLTTGVMGLALAASFAKTQSMYLPVGLHFGWNLAIVSVFSNGPRGEQILVAETTAQTVSLGPLPSFFLMLLQNAFPLLVLWYLNRGKEAPAQQIN